MLIWSGPFCHRPNLKSSTIESMQQKNYVLKTAKIRFIVLWQKENTEVEVRIVLPELYFEKILPMIINQN
ncbi:hypothetical protein [Desulfosporosinus sp. OT]|uniref:hypothetical protein n=1 Tax=Desulfosporosinus sp. OT TaxID=913865 RepID=UPI00058C802C|nr:hypothetical protein [Desulfosporosinus sp. OT]